jgi:predicted RNA-binding Zn-ribbon protein involved in translation (DUF1610 family)
MGKLQDGRKDLPVFIHSELDDYGLDPYEFRVYSRLARRAGQGEAMESALNIAKTCGISERKVRDAINLLFAARLIEKEFRKGQSSIIRLNPKEKWERPERLETLRAEVLSYRGGAVHSTEAGAVRDTEVVGTSVHSTDQSGTTNRGGAVHSTDKGSPCEGSPVKVLQKTSASATPQRQTTANPICPNCRRGTNVFPVAGSAEKHFKCPNCGWNTMANGNGKRAGPQSFHLPNEYFWVKFQERYRLEYQGLEYVLDGGDVTQYNKMKRSRKDQLKPPLWDQALDHFFASVLGEHRLRHLCSRLAEFYKHPLNEYGKPLVESRGGSTLPPKAQKTHANLQPIRQRRTGT